MMQKDIWMQENQYKNKGLSNTDLGSTCSKALRRYHSDHDISVILKTQVLY